jgi:hypothetical protein
LALDLNAKLAIAAPDELRWGLSELATKPWAVLAGSGVTLLRKDPATFRADTPPPIVEPLVPQERYGVLEAAGILAIGNIVTSSGEIPLAGGSISRTALDLNAFVVRKRAAVSQMSDEDGIQRHRAEARWLSRQKSGLFPKTWVDVDDTELLQYSMKFVPRYTLGELILQDRASSMDVVRVLELALGLLEEWVYHSGPLRSQESYISVVRRRLSFLGSRDTEWGRRIRRWLDEGVVVNGLRCRPLGVALRQLEQEEIFRAIAHPVPGRGCHGDLIAEGILIDASFVESPILVDPNPRNSSPLVDAGKLLMTFRFHFDLMLRDLFKINVIDGRRPDQVSLFFPGDASRRESFNLEVAAMLSSSQVINNLPSFAGRQIDDIAINAQAALHVLAICPFYALHHDKAARALGFLAVGMAGLEEVLRLTEL